MSIELIAKQTWLSISFSHDRQTSNKVAVWPINAIPNYLALSVSTVIYRDIVERLKENPEHYGGDAGNVNLQKDKSGKMKEKSCCWRNKFIHVFDISIFYVCFEIDVYG